MSKNKELVTVITEAVLETELSKKLESLGANGYTIVDVRGKGRQGDRGGDWKESANIKIEIVCNEAVAEAITQALQKQYFDNFAMIVHQSPVNVLRSDRF